MKPIKKVSSICWKWIVSCCLVSSLISPRLKGLDGFGVLPPPLLEVELWPGWTKGPAKKVLHSIIIDGLAHDTPFPRPLRRRRSASLCFARVSLPLTARAEMLSVAAISSYERPLKYRNTTTSRYESGSSRTDCRTVSIEPLPAQRPGLVASCGGPGLDLGGVGVRWSLPCW